MLGCTLQNDCWGVCALDLQTDNAPHTLCVRTHRLTQNNSAGNIVLHSPPKHTRYRTPRTNTAICPPEASMRHFRTGRWSQCHRRRGHDARGLDQRQLLRRNGGAGAVHGGWSRGSRWHGSLRFVNCATCMNMMEIHFRVCGVFFGGFKNNIKLTT